MKQKKYFILAAAALLMAACSENDIAEKQNPQAQQAGEQAVEFDAYVNRGMTRAGQVGTLTTGTLESGAEASKIETGGFGVFGYYTNDELYSQNSKPEFFYNQKVYYTTEWQYDPVKYWPNEFGSSAESYGEDKLTFFAYAPYVPVDLSTGIAQTSTGDKLETGIISLTRNTSVGDPYVKYYADFDPETCVDLCFGVAKNEFKNSVDGAKNSIDAGMPYIDVKKPTLGDRINFDFKHALAQLNVQIDADVDEMSHGAEPLSNYTKIYVREVTFEGIADKGMLNLNSEALPGMSYNPKWVDLSGINEIRSGKITIYDGRRDGREGQDNAEAANEKPQSLNPTIISNDGNTTIGVIGESKKNLFDGNTADAPILVIPTGQQLAITIVYDVETADANLATFLSDGKTHGSSVENKIYKAISYSGSPLTLEAGKKYTVNLHLGLTSVKFDASVTDWTIVSPAYDYDLPVNAPKKTLTAATTPTTDNLTVSANANTGVFAVNGLDDSGTATATITTDFTGLTFTPATGTTIGTDGVMNVNYSIPANEKVTKVTGDISVSDGSKSAKLTITQEAHPLGLQVKTVATADGTSFELDADAKMAATDWTGATWTVKRTRSGGAPETIEVVAGAAVTGKIGLATTDGGSGDHYATLSFFTDEEAQGGDVYTITVTAGNAAAETVSFTVQKLLGAISYADANKDVNLTAAATPAAYQSITHTTGDGTVTYRIEKIAGTGTTTATIGENTGVVTFTLPEADKGDKFRVTATVVDGTNYYYEIKSVSYTITIVPNP
jgi:hypothetical protein